MFDLIKQLSELIGPVGQEGRVLDEVEQFWRDAGADISRTRTGNVLATAGERGPRLLVAAHADELCYLVRAIDAGGFLWLANGQAWQRATSVRNWFTVGQRVTVLARSGDIPGLIASATGHLATIALSDPSELTWNDFWVDTGLTRDELLAAGVTPGTRIVWDAETVRLGPLVSGKALDDRVPLAAMTELLRRVPPAELGCRLTLACTVQEEIGVIGASALAARLAGEYDAAIVVEIGLAGDIPGLGDNQLPTKLGGGPLLVHKDAAVHYDHALTAGLEATAAAADIAIQHAVFGSFGSDGSAFMRADIPSAMVAFAARYTHSPFETAHLGDIEQLVDWLCAFARAPRGIAGEA